MEHFITTYAKLLLSYKPSDVLKIMKRRGHGSLWRRALCQAERLAQKAQARSEVLLTLAQASGKEKHAANIAKANMPEATRVIIDKNIIGGFILTKGFTRVDRSYKTALTKLYNKITA